MEVSEPLRTSVGGIPTRTAFRGTRSLFPQCILQCIHFVKGTYIPYGLIFAVLNFRGFARFDSHPRKFSPAKI